MGVYLKMRVIFSLLFCIIRAPYVTNCLFIVLFLWFYPMGQVILKALGSILEGVIAWSILTDRAN